MIPLPTSDASRSVDKFSSSLLVVRKSEDAIELRLLNCIDFPASIVFSRHVISFAFPDEALFLRSRRMLFHMPGSAKKQLFSVMKHWNTANHWVCNLFALWSRLSDLRWFRIAYTSSKEHIFWLHRHHDSNGTYVVFRSIPFSSFNCDVYVLWLNSLTKSIPASEDSVSPSHTALLMNINQDIWLLCSLIVQQMWVLQSIFVKLTLTRTTKAKFPQNRKIA